MLQRIIIGLTCMVCGAIMRCSIDGGIPDGVQSEACPKNSPSKEKDLAASVIALTGDSWELLRADGRWYPKSNFWWALPPTGRVGNFDAGKGILVTPVETWVLAKRTTPPAWHFPTQEERATFLTVIPPPLSMSSRKKLYKFIYKYICKIYKYNI